MPPNVCRRGRVVCALQPDLIRRRRSGSVSTRRLGMDRGTAMLAVVLDVYEGGKDLIPGWKLKEHAERALATGGVEGLRRYYEACLFGSDHRVKTTLEGDRRKTLESERARLMAMYLGPARR